MKPNNEVAMIGQVNVQKTFSALIAKTEDEVFLAVPPELAPVLKTVLRHYQYALDKHPDFPTDLIQQGALVAEEAGELIKECNNENKSLARHEAYQTCAVTLRMLTQLEV